MPPDLAGLLAALALAALVLLVLWAGREVRRRRDAIRGDGPPETPDE